MDARRGWPRNTYPPSLRGYDDRNKRGDSRLLFLWRPPPSASSRVAASFWSQILLPRLKGRKKGQGLASTSTRPIIKPEILLLPLSSRTSLSHTPAAMAPYHSPARVLKMRGEKRRKEHMQRGVRDREQERDPYIVMSTTIQPRHPLLLQFRLPH